MYNGAVTSWLSDELTMWQDDRAFWIIFAAKTKDSELPLYLYVTMVAVLFVSKFCYWIRYDYFAYTNSVNYRSLEGGDDEVICLLPMHPSRKNPTRGFLIFLPNVLRCHC